MWRKAETQIALIATLVSIVTAAVVFQMGATNYYKDAVSHMLIARRVIDSVTPGFAQLGAVWPPLPHVLSLPFIWHDGLYKSGLAGTFVSMAGYVLAVTYMFKLGRRLAGAGGGIVAALVLGANANTLYMQSTAMTELLMIGTLVAGIFYFVEWAHEEKLSQLALSSFFLFLCSLTRYEGWIVLLLLGPVLLYVCWSKGYSFEKAQGIVIFWGFVAFLGALSWMAWGALIFGDPLEFQRGEYSQPSLWVSEGEGNVGNWVSSLLTYTFAIKHIAGVATIVLAVLGAVVFFLKERLNARTIAPAVLIALLPIFVIMLFKGQRPLNVPEVQNGMYNIRFALIMLVPMAVFIGYLARNRTISPLLASVVIIVAALHGQHEVITLKEPLVERQYGVTLAQLTAADWFATHYDGGTVLGENYGNEVIVFAAVRGRDHIYEGSFQVWERALENPPEYADWILMRGAPDFQDRVWTELRGSELVAEHYELVYERDHIEIYRRKAGKENVAIGNSSR